MKFSYKKKLVSSTITKVNFAEFELNDPTVIEAASAFKNMIHICNSLYFLSIVLQ